MINEQQLRSCPVCQSPILSWAVKKYLNDIYAIDRCSQCGYAFVNPRPSLDCLKAHYVASGHGASSGRLSLKAVLAAEADDPNSTIDAKRILATIGRLLVGQHGRSGLLLDVGSGYGFFSREAIKSGFRVIAIDLAENEREISKSVSGIDPVPIAFEDLELENASVSAILMSQVLEHALDVEVGVKKASRLLETDGILALALPNFGSLQRLILQENEPYICPPDHLNFFTPEALTRLLEKNGFVVEEIQHVSRIPRSSVARRMPKIATHLANPLRLIVNMMLGVADFMRLGSIINVYGRKVSI